MTIEPANRRAVVRGLVLEADGVLVVDLQSLDGQPFAPWEPGAHVDVRVGDGSSRQFSLCGTDSPPRPDRLRIAVRHDPTGRGGSAWIHRTLRPGDEVDLRGPRNHFALEDAPGWLFVAGGIGITPLLPMVASAVRRGVPWQLAYFGRSRRTMPFLDELVELSAAEDRLRVLPSDEVHDVTLTDVIDAAGRELPERHLVYVCGPDRMLAETGEVLAARGRSEDLRLEHFAASGSVGATAGSFTARLERRGLDVHVPAGQSLLSVLTASGVDVLSDCEEGICGSCETRVLAGRVDHRDVVLTAGERSAGDCMMVCVSRAADDRLVLDL